MEEAKESRDHSEKIKKVINELIESESRYISMADFAHSNFDRYLTEPAVDINDTQLLKTYLAQWDTLKALYDQLPFELLSNEKHHATQNFTDFYTSQPFISYQTWHLGLFFWTKHLADLSAKYEHIIPVNRHGKEGASAVAISAVQRLPRHELLATQVQKADDTLNSDVIKRIKALITSVNELNPGDTHWNAQTNEALNAILNAIRASTVGDIDKIKAYHNMIDVIGAGVLGNEHAAERLAAQRNYAKVAFELIKEQLQKTSTLTDMVQLTSYLKDIRDSVQTPAGTDKTLKRLWGGESTDGQKTIQKQLREFFSESSHLFEKATALMTTSSETTVEKATMARTLLNLVLGRGNAINTTQLTCARLLAKAALDEAVEEYKKTGHMDERMRETMVKIYNAVASSTVDKFFKRVSGHTASHGMNKSIQKCLREFIDNPSEYVTSLSPDSKASSHIIKS